MNTQPTLESANAKLNRLHIRLTPQRHAVLEALHQEPHRPSIEALCRRLAPRFPRLNAATVRNTVQVFDKMGLLPEACKEGDANRVG
jgi:Fur family peroxide stress response transcriptional regulator